MTTIVGIQGLDYALLVADSQITEDNLVTLAVSTPKIVSVGKFLLGISGDTRPGDILSYNWKPPTYRGDDPVQFMGKKVIPVVSLSKTSDEVVFPLDFISILILSKDVSLDDSEMTAAGYVSPLTTLSQCQIKGLRLNDILR